MAQASSANVWPTLQQHQLLTAALGEGEAAAVAFRAWRQNVDLDDDVDRGSVRLMPLLFDNLRRLGVREPLMGRLRGMYRLTWYQNHVLFDDARPIIAALEEAGIETLLLKGVPLSLIYYGNHALRPMGDIDIAVRPQGLRRAVALLEELGWRRTAPSSDDDFTYRHALCFTNAKGRDLDLHWHILYEASRVAMDEHFWSHAQPFDFAGVATRTLDPTDMLLHVVIHGIRWNPEPSTRWVADAITILRHADRPLDWDRLVSFALAQKLTHRLALGLEYLAENFAAPVPPEVIETLRGTRVSLRERIENSVILRDTDRIYANVLGKQWVIFADYCRKTTAAGPVEFCIGLSHYVRYRWGLRGRLEIVPVILNGLRRRLTPSRLRAATRPPSRTTRGA